MASITIPTHQRAAIRQPTPGAITIHQIPVPQPGPGQILVKISCSGLCGSDKALLHDEWAPFGLQMFPPAGGIAGHEGVGVVVAVGAGMEARWKLGDRAGIKWIQSTCGECEFCRNGVDEVSCPRQMVSGVTVAGTFQEYCLVDGRYTSKIPDGVADEEAGPIMCGGVTIYSALKRSQVKPGQWVVLPGAGGGLGHMGVQFAKAMGMRVIAIDSGDEKRRLCLDLGAEHFIDFATTDDIAAEVTTLTTHGAHGVVVTAGNQAAYSSAPAFLRPNGTMVAVGLPDDPSVVAGGPPMSIIMKRLNIVGSAVGSLREVEEALDFTARGLVKPIVTMGKLEDLGDWLEKMRTGKIAGRVVLQIAS